MRVYPSAHIFMCTCLRINNNNNNNDNNNNNIVIHQIKIHI